MSEARINRWTASDGVELAWRELGEGKAAILLHGLFSDSEMNWIRFGHAERIAREGFRVIMPDLRAHGLSARPHEPEAYPKGVLARDLGELVGKLELEDYDLGGFSLGARTVVQGVGEGLRPQKAVLAGMGLQGLEGWERRQDFFQEAIERFDTSSRGDRYWLAIQFMKTMKVDRVAASHLLSSFEDGRREWLQAFTMPTLVISGSEDRDNGSPQDLADTLPGGICAEIPGTHMSSVTKAELGEEIARFLAGEAQVAA